MQLSICEINTTMHHLNTSPLFTDFFLILGLNYGHPRDAESGPKGIHTLLAGSTQGK